jgi:hypothetical protein
MNLEPYLAAIARRLRTRLDGYIVYAGEDFEWAYLHWVEKEASVKAFATPEGKTGPADSASFQHARGPSVQIFPGDLGK